MSRWKGRGGNEGRKREGGGEREEKCSATDGGRFASFTFECGRPCIQDTFSDVLENFPRFFLFKKGFLKH